MIFSFESKNKRHEFTYLPQREQSPTRDNKTSGHWMCQCYSKCSYSIWGKVGQVWSNVQWDNAKEVKKALEETALKINKKLETSFVQDPDLWKALNLYWQRPYRDLLSCYKQCCENPKGYNFLRQDFSKYDLTLPHLTPHQTMECLVKVQMPSSHTSIFSGNSPFISKMPKTSTSVPTCKGQMHKLHCLYHKV